MRPLGVRTGHHKRTLWELKGPVTGVGFSPDGKVLAAGLARLAKDQETHEGGEVVLWALAGLLKGERDGYPEKAPFPGPAAKPDAER